MHLTTGRATDADLVDAAVRGSPTTTSRSLDGVARTVAARWQDNGSPGLVALATSGAIDLAGTYREIQDCLTVVNHHFDLTNTVVADGLALCGLATYVVRHGDRAAQPGWARPWA